MLVQMRVNVRRFMRMIKVIKVDFKVGLEKVAVVRSNSTFWSFGDDDDYDVSFLEGFFGHVSFVILEMCHLRIICGSFT